MKRCTSCLMPDTRPRMEMRPDGLCPPCHYHLNVKPKIDYRGREKEFIDLIESMKLHPTYDCIVPYSGGKDSAVIAYRLKHELGFNPLLVTYGQMMWTESGKHNYDRIRHMGEGIDCLYFAMNQRVSKKLCRRFLIERGHPKAHYDAAINAVPILIAKQMNIPAVIYAEHGETEYGGLVRNKRAQKERDLEEVLEHCVGDDARNWVGEGITEQDLYPYIYPEDVGGVRAFYWSYFFRWDIYENAIFARDKLGFKPAHIHRTPLEAHWKWGRSDGSFEGFDSLDDCIDDLDFFMMHRKFGFGRATRMASRLIQYGHMTREEAIPLVGKYDGEYPLIYLSRVLEYLGMTEEELQAIITQHTEDLVDEEGISSMCPLPEVKNARPRAGMRAVV